MKLFFVTVVMSWGLVTHAQPSDVDRRATVLAAHRLLPILLKVLSTDSVVLELPARQRTIFNAVLAVSQNTNCPIVFNADSSHFDLAADQGLRYMRTLKGGPSPIEVNLKLLNEPERHITLPFLMKTLFHEYAWKTAAHEMSDRDQVAQMIEDEAHFFTHQVTMDSGETLTYLTIPKKLVTEKLADVSVNRPQPTVAVLIERGGVDVDVTEVLLKSLEKSSSLIRSLFTDLNRFLMMALGTMMDLFVKLQQEVVRATGMPNFDFIRYLMDFFNPLLDLRLFEIQEVEVTGHTVRFKAVWENSHKAFNEEENRAGLRMRVNIKGLDITDTLPVPMTIVMRLPLNPEQKLSTEDFSVSIRPENNMLTVAKVGPLFRNNGHVQKMLVDIPYESSGRSDESHPPVFLSASCGEGFRWIKAQSTTRKTISTVTASFEIPWDTLPYNQPIVAESVVVGLRKSLYLNRLVELNELDSTEPILHSNSLIPGQTAIEGVGTHLTRLLITETNPLIPLPMTVSGFQIDMPHIRADDLTLLAQLSAVEKVTEVRLEYKRTDMIMTDIVSPEEIRDRKAKPEFRLIKWGGQTHRVMINGNIVKKEDSYETISLTASDLTLTPTGSGHLQIKARTQLPFYVMDVENSHQGQTLPMFLPIRIEIHLVSGQVLVHEFGQVLPDFCEMILRRTK